MVLDIDSNNIGEDLTSYQRHTCPDGDTQLVMWDAGMTGLDVTAEWVLLEPDNIPIPEPTLPFFSSQVNSYFQDIMECS